MTALSQEIYSGYRRILAEEREQGLELGIKKGRRTGRRDGERSTLIRQMRIRFGRLPRGVAARVKGASRVSLDRWLERILTAESLEQVFADE